MRVWVTRAEPDAQRTAAALRAAGHEPFVAPLLQVQPLAGAAEALDAAVRQAGALSFTSATAVRAYAALRPLSERDWPVFAVGEATAAAARDAGFEDVACAHGDVSALAAFIAAARPSAGVLHPRAKEPAGDLAADLMRRGIPARSEPIYETLPRTPTAALLERLAAEPPSLDAVLVHSAKGARALADILASRPALAKRLVLCAISAQAAEPLAEIAFARRILAAAPDEPSMLKALTR